MVYRALVPALAAALLLSVGCGRRLDARRLLSDAELPQGAQQASTPRNSYCDDSQKSCQTVASFEGTFLDAGLTIKWNHQTRKLAYTKQLRDGYYDIFTSDEEGKNERPLTVDHPDLPNRHQGAPDWHPSGKYLVFVAEKREHKGSSAHALPGFGGYSDIWIITADAKRVWRLTDLPNDYAHGVLLPKFSRDGRQVIWAEREKAPRVLSLLELGGSYAMKVADFRERPEPRFENVRRIQPGGNGFYEASDISQDGQTLLFTSNFGTGNFWKNQVYSLDLRTGAARQLTKDGYNEHPSFTPGERAILYMSNHQVDRLKGWPGTDWWIMDRDGENKRRITFMNKHRHPHSNGHPMWAGMVAWSPDGDWFYGDVQTSLITQAGKIVKVRVRCECQ